MEHSQKIIGKKGIKWREQTIRKKLEIKRKVLKWYLKMDLFKL